MTPPARLAAGAGGLAWLGSFAGWGMGIDAVVAGAGLAIVVLLLVAVGRLPSGAVLLATVAVGAAVSGHAAAGREANTLNGDVPVGRVEVIGTVADEPVAIRDEIWVVVDAGQVLGSSLRLPPIAVVWAADPIPGPGDRVAAVGRLSEYRGYVRDDAVAGRLHANQTAILARAGSPLHRAAATVRNRVHTVLRVERGDAGDALLAGFLIGDTTGLTDRAIEDLRASGLSHFVAVSGSNVALFLGAWWFVIAPLAGPRVRAATGLVGLALFVVVTRWEPSVLRAATMIGLVLVGRLAGIPIDPTVALGWGVTVLLLVAGHLAASVGFQLSVAATIGVMIGVRLTSTRRPRAVWSILGATAGAQVAVAPIVLFHFGTIPLMAPLANLIAAPLVTAATGLGGLAVLLGGGPLLAIARIPADGVLWISEWFAGWPQLDGAELAAVVAAGLLTQVRRLRAAASLALVLSLAMTAMPSAPPAGASLVALSVGQGDAVLLRDGAVVLIDGGPDPARLHDALDRQRIRRVDVVVATHGDADHVAGLLGITGKIEVGELWIPAFGDAGELLEALIVECRQRQIPIHPVAAGIDRHIGRLNVSTLGPARRYKSDNDGSIVLWIEAGPASILLPGDIELVAQRELPPLRPDVMVVPHHGAATTDLEWLAATAGSIAIVSVGQNPYGHPRAEVLDTLAATGTRVLTTENGGDVVVALLPP